MNKLPEKMIKKGFIFASSRQTNMSRDGSTGNLPHDCNFKFYYIPESEMKLIEDIYNILADFHKYEIFIEKLHPIVKNIINKSRDFEMDDQYISDYVDEYFDDNLHKFTQVELN